MANLIEIVSFLNTELRISDFDDTSLNGLQIEGASEVKKVAVAVDAALATVRLAVEKKSDLLIAHHGLFWGTPWAITGSKKELVKESLSGGLSIYAAHLPLDAHTEYGNNFCLAKLLGLTQLELAFNYRGQKIGCLAANGSQQSLSKLVEIMETLPGGSPILTLPFGPTVPKRIGIISGSGISGLEELEKLGFDTFITGETRQSAYHIAREQNINIIFAGHYRTETVGVIELGKLLKKNFSVDWEFIDCPTGI